MAHSTFCFGLLRRRQAVLPTWRGLALAMLLLGGTLVLVARALPHFLILRNPQPGGLLVVEGYAWDAMLAQAKAEFEKGDYELLLITGGPMEKGEALLEYKTTPHACAAILQAMGMDGALLRPVVNARVARDRTYASAVALRDWLAAEGRKPGHITLMAEALHSRRSVLLFQKALGEGVRVTSLPYENPEADLTHWWRTSGGVRGVVGELLAWLYARVFFHPDL